MFCAKLIGMIFAIAKHVPNYKEKKSKKNLHEGVDGLPILDIMEA